jgi:GNAT superfamily N-acetyltransferase
MSRRVTALTSDTVPRLPTPCRGCLFWELGVACPQPRTDAVLPGLALERPPDDPQARKRAWVSERVEEGHPPGRVVVADGAVVGYALFGPARSFAPRATLAPARSPDALVLATVWIAPTHREHGLGRLLLQASVKEAIRQGRPAVEVHADHRWRDRSCLLPATWLLHEGFVVHREHPRTPLLRLDVRRTARWSGPLEHAWDEVLARLPRRVPGTVRTGEQAPAPDASGYRGTRSTSRHR